MGLALTGVFTGIDTDALVNEMVAIESRPLAALRQRKSLYESRQSAVEAIRAALVQLQSHVATLRGAENLRHVLAASSDTNVLIALESQGASEGVHSVVVNQLARGHRLVHTDGLAELTSTVGAEKSTALNANGVADADATWFTTTANGATYTFDFGDEPDIDNVAFAPSTDYTMNEVAALINVRSQAVAGYDAASVEYDSQQGKYFLRLTAEESSTAGALTQTLTAGDAVDELNDEADWNKTAAGAGAFVYTYDGVTRTINVSSDTTLEGLRDLINNDALNPGVTASILAHDSAYHLVLAGDSTGADYAVAIDDFLTTLNGFDTGDFTTSQQAQNAEFRVDGYPADPNWIQRNSNTVTDVLPGVTLRLLSTGTSTVTLSRDTSSLKDELHAFVAYYNEVVDLIAAYTAYDEANDARGLLQGDGTVTRLLSGFRDDLISQVAGFIEGEGNDTFVLPVQLGLTIDREGHLELDETVYDEAMAADYLGALSLVGERNRGASDSSYLQFVGATDDTRAGQYEVEVDFDGVGAVIAARIRFQGDSAWRALTVFDNRLEGAEGTDEEGLVLTAVWDGVSSTQEANVRVKRGFACAIHDELEALLESTTGAVQLKTDQFADTIEQLEKNIELQERRITETEARLREKYARLEATLSALDSQRASLESILESMSYMWRRND